MANEPESKLHLELRDDGTSRQRSIPESESGRGRDIYLIERQAIALRRRRWQATDEAVAAEDAGRRDAGRRKRTKAAPDLSAYERPREAPPAHTKAEGVVGRALAWLRQSIASD